MNNRRITMVRPSQIFDIDEVFNTKGLSTISSGGVEIDMYEDELNIVVNVKAPGYSEEEVEITVDGNTLNVKGNSRHEDRLNEENKRYYIKEIKYDSFTRSITLHSKVDPEESSAEFKNGIIIITMKKFKDEKPKLIPIKTRSK